MNGRELTERLNELNKTGKLQCNDKELEELLAYGIILQSGNKYITRNGSAVIVDILKSKNYKFNLDMTGIICTCEEIAEKENIKRIYCMTETTFNKYKESNNIIVEDDINYFKFFENELWRVVIL